MTASPGQPAAEAVRAERHEQEPTHRPVIGLVIVIGFAAVLALAFVHLPREQAPLPAAARYATQIAIPKWGTTEPVNEVVYGSRGFDTFGETYLLLAAVVCVTMLSRPKEPRLGFIGEEAAGQKEQSEDDPSSGGGHADAREAEAAETDDDQRTDVITRRPTPDWQPLGQFGPERSRAMTVIVRVAARLATPILAVGGVYLAAWGYSPGGGFPAGAVIAGVALLVYAAFGYDKVARIVRPGVIEPIELAGALAIITCEALGLVLKGSFSANWIPLAPLETIRAGGILQVFSGSELVEVGTGLVLVIFAILGMGHDWTPDEADDQ
ncbi:MAG TPA: MnhB domain-containing protein [Acidimicrobiales bacterium]|jgi:multicomponent Na+:H+ antiporter subunit B|nr:MnhB domain-containing protein [Acidimicrobiales bacterium]